MYDIGKGVLLIDQFNIKNVNNISVGGRTMPLFPPLGRTCENLMSRTLISRGTPSHLDSCNNLFTHPWSPGDPALIYGPINKERHQVILYLLVLLVIRPRTSFTQKAVKCNAPNIVVHG